jgi:hypothetical protein
MPNGGITPDCVHCKWFRGRPYTEEVSRCEFHNINLPTYIYVFCSSYVDPESDDGDWLDKELDREQLQRDTMYQWIGGYEVKFFHVPLALIAEFRDWSLEKYRDEFEKLVDNYRGQLPPSDRKVWYDSRT